MMGNDMKPNVCKCGHHKTGSVLAIVFGLLFLAGHFGYVSANVVSIGWPVIVIAAGLMKMTSSKCKCC